MSYIKSRPFDILTSNLADTPTNDAVIAIAVRLTDDMTKLKLRGVRRTEFVYTVPTSDTAAENENVGFLQNFVTGYKK